MSFYNCDSRGAGPGCNTQEVSEKVTDLREELRKLEDHEQLLDEHTQWILQSIKNIQNDIINRKYAYVTYEDIKENFVDQLVLGVQASPDTELKVSNASKIFEVRTFIWHEIFNVTSIEIFVLIFLLDIYMCLFCIFLVEWCAG